MIAFGDHSRSDAQPTVFVVDDDVSVREALEPLIRQAGWRPALCASAGEFFGHPRVKAASCLILDVRLPDVDGLCVQGRIGVDQARTPIIFVTGYGDVPTTVKAMKAGAFEFLTKPFTEDELLSAMRGAIELSRNALRDETELQALRKRYSSLTSRERQVMELVVGGALNREVADELEISVITVKAHRANMMRKMVALSLAQLVQMAARLKKAIP
jgi:FixJ family two-component response regulator